MENEIPVKELRNSVGGVMDRKYAVVLSVKLLKGQPEGFGLFTIITSQVPQMGPNRGNGSFSRKLGLDKMKKCCGTIG